MSFAIMLAGVLFLALLHGIFPWLDRKSAPYKKVWYPFSGGIAIGYVFLYLLPKLSDHTAIILETNPGAWELKIIPLRSGSLLLTLVTLLSLLLCLLFFFLPTLTAT